MLAPFAEAHAAANSEPIPFRYVYHGIFVRVQLDGTGPYIFVIDTDRTPSAIDLGVAKHLNLNFESGVEMVIPRKLLQGLQHASVAKIATVDVVAGKMLHWESLDVDHYIPSSLAGVFGNRRWMSEIGRRGGLVRSDAKTRAVRENGRKGGRPRTRAA